MNHYLVYADGGYERDKPLFIVPTEQVAKACQLRMTQFKQRALERLPEFTADFAPDDPEWNRQNDAREAAIAKIKWPYGIDLMYEGDVCYVKVQFKAKP
jgi:hypothetical protein